MNAQQIGEDNLIRRLKRLVPGRADVIAGIGDDCAVVRTGRRDPYDLLLKSDPVIEGVHFDPEAKGAAIGHKALGRVFSDLAAMGGEPLWIMVDLVSPPTGSVAHIEAIYKGLARLARRYGAAIVGGDTSSGKVLEVHVFAVGRVRRRKAIMRSGARPGDVLYVTGTLGGSGLGRHLTFEPRLAEGQWLRKSGLVTAMMDVSDGLATDLRRMAAASGTGAVLDIARIPISAAALRMKQEPNPSKEGSQRREAHSLLAPLLGGVGVGFLLPASLKHALADGEDFELLFTVPRRKVKLFEPAWRKVFCLPCTRIGEMTAKPGRVELRDGLCCEELTLRGYEHFNHCLQ
ncbi:MAG: thiamine-phosphate kinase [bacterium]